MKWCLNSTVLEKNLTVTIFSFSAIYFAIYKKNKKTKKKTEIFTSWLEELHLEIKNDSRIIGLVLFKKLKKYINKVNPFTMKTSDFV